MVGIDASQLHVKWESEAAVFNYLLNNLGKIRKTNAGTVTQL